MLISLLFLLEVYMTSPVSYALIHFFFLEVFLTCPVIYGLIRFCNGKEMVRILLKFVLVCVCSWHLV